jgi:hypothetical protein
MAQPGATTQAVLLGCFIPRVGRDPHKLELVLRGLVDRGLMTTTRAVNAGDPRRSDGQRGYGDDWWDLTPAGRAAIGLGPRKLFGSPAPQPPG